MTSSTSNVEEHLSEGSTTVGGRNSSYVLVEVPFTVHPQVVREEKRPSVIYQQVSFTEPIQLSFISFRNYYCGEITIKRLVAGKGGENMWQTMLHRYKLMEKPHHEDDSQSRHIIKVSKFNSNYDGEPIKDLRFYLYQSSPTWRSFGLRQLACHTRVFRNSIKPWRSSKDILPSIASSTASLPITTSTLNEAIQGVLRSVEPLHMSRMNLPISSSNTNRSSIERKKTDSKCETSNT
mmetsp:Transcript_22407/g.31363  ORF Transcript_22407/g.31363 Transcript_22407/m.31363 type:complete len:236 (+) Transcript_22407:69-776(+)